MVTDPISDMLTRIRNAQAVRHETVGVPFSNLKLKIVQILAEKNFIKDFKKVKGKEQKIIKIYLKYTKDNLPVIYGLKRISKPGQRIYIKANDIRKVKAGGGINIISTSKGIMTGKEAKRKALGGEVLAEIW